MSSRTYILYGYGVSSVLNQCRDQDVIKETADFILEWDKELAEFLEEEFHGKKDADSVIEAADCFYEHDHGFSGALAYAVIDYCKEKYGIRLSYAEETEYSPEMLVFSEGFPWQLSEKEKSLTAKDLDSIFVDAFSRCGLTEEEIREDCAYRESESFG